MRAGRRAGFRRGMFRPMSSVMQASSLSLEDSPIFTPRFNADGLIPAIAQEANGGAVLMMAWMNAEALRLTLETAQAVYWSRSRQALWRKGETSGHSQRVLDVRVDCDQDCLLLIIEQIGPACHTGAAQCFYRRVESDGSLTPLKP